MTTVTDQAWAITDAQREVIYGVVDAASEHDALLAVINDPARTLFDGDRGAREIDAVPLDELTDGRWREMAPVGPGSQGDCGGDVQVSDSFSRRFALAKPGGIWAVVTLAWYSINESVEAVASDTEGEVIERQVEYLIVDDLRDLDYTIWWNDAYTKEDEWAPTEAGAREAAEKFTMAELDWDGDEFR